MNACTSQFIQQVLLSFMQPKQDMPMLRENDNLSENFGSHKGEKSTLEEQKMEGDYKDLVSKNSNTGSRARDGLSEYTPQAGLLASELSSSLRQVTSSKQDFPAGKPVSNIKYYYRGSKNNNLFYPFNDQLDYALANYFPDFESTKSNVDRFLPDLLMVPLTENLSFQNVDKWIEKLLNIP